MKTELIKITNVEKSKDEIKRAASILVDGGLVVIPTETVYGLGGNGLDKNAAEKIYEAKGRPSDNPLILHIAEPVDAEKYCVTNELYYRLADAFMPGPITVIMEKKDIVPLSVTGGLGTVAVRCPSHPVAHEIIKKAGIPIAAPSANLSGKPSPTRADYVLEDMDGRVDMIIDGGECEIGLESTIVKLDGNEITLLRPGAVTYDALTLISQNVEIAPAVIEQLSENERPLSPGMKYKHYAPSTPLVLLDGEDSRVLDFMINEQKSRNCNCVLICYNEEIEFLKDENLLPIGARDNTLSHAHLLFSHLRDADKMGCEIIYAHLPKKDGLGLALYNRLIRAAAHTVKKID